MSLYKDLESLSRIELYKRIRELEQHTLDELTSLPLRWQLRKKLEEFEQRKTAEPFGILFIDIDHFKKLNDLLSHSEGDRALKEVVYVIQNQLRPSDMLFRWGGEEFVVLIMAHSDINIQKLAERVRTGVEEYSWWKVGLPNITISVGCTKASFACATDTSHFDEAARALKLAKKTRNTTQTGTNMFPTLSVE
jgi:diguanylate cyclase (GGDEF)-like protein